MLRASLKIGARVAVMLVANTGVAGDAAPDAGPPPPPSIVVAEAAERRVSDRVLASGSIVAVEEVSVSPLVEGLAIRAVLVDHGDWVERGGTLAVLNDDALLLERSQLAAGVAKAEATLAQLRAQRAEARANAEEAARAAARADRLSANRTVSTAEADRLRALATAADARLRAADQALDIAAADIALARAQLDDAELRLARTAVTAPVSGLVSARQARIGAIASGGGAPLFSIIRDGTVEMRAEVAEAGIVRLAVGDPATVRLAGSGTTVRGTVRLIGPTVDPITRLGTVHIALAGAVPARVGMYASAVIIAGEVRAVTVPRTAVTAANGTAIVRKVEDGVVRVAPVSVGIQDGPLVEIRSGLAAGERVVAKAGAFVRDGDRIVPVAADAADDDRADHDRADADRPDGAP